MEHGRSGLGWKSHLRRPRRRVKYGTEGDAIDHVQWFVPPAQALAWSIVALAIVGAIGDGYTSCADSHGRGVMIRLLIADDHVLFRRAISLLLQHDPGARDIEIVGEASTGREALTLALDRHPHVALLDFNMPDGNGL